MRRCNINRMGKKASALSYTPADPAPRIIASGRGRDAERIIGLARAAGIEIVEDAALAALLDAGSPGECIPPWCWDAVAKILAFVLAKEEK
jgi:flagellar biosynthesis protein